MARLRLLMGPYEKFGEYWCEPRAKKDTTTEGAVRVVDGVICYAATSIITLEEPEYDIYAQREIEDIHVYSWVPISELEEKLDGEG